MQGSRGEAFAAGRNGTHKTSPPSAFLTECSKQVLVLPGSDSSHAETHTDVLCACCGSCSKALKSSHALFREPGHKACIMEHFSSVTLGYCDFSFPYRRKSEII